MVQELADFRRIDRQISREQAQQTLPGGIEGVPIIVNGQTIGWNIGGEFFTQEEVDALIATGKFPEEPSGPGRAPPAFSSTQAAQAQAEAFRREQDRLNREFQAQQERLATEARAEENRLAEEAALKRGRLSTLTDLIQSFVGAQSQARDTLANLQPDQFRFAAVAGGIAPFGVTPQQGFTQQLQQFAGAPVPTADPNASLPSIESAIQGLTGAQVPLSPQVFGTTQPGLAGGGTVAPSAQPQSFLVGEKGPEVMTVTTQGVQVTPLVGGMQEGGAIGFPFEPIKFDRETLLPALGTSGIFSEFGEIPRARIGGKGISVANQGFFGRPGSAAGFRNLDLLGIQPGLVRFGREDAIFLRGPSGELQHIPNPEAFHKAGFNISDVVSLDPASRGGFSFGEFTGRPDIPTERPSAFTKFSAPIIEPTTGTLLPAPFTVASEMNRLRLTNPTVFNLLLSAYETAGVPAGAVLGGLQSSLSFGAERGSVGLR